MNNIKKLEAEADVKQALTRAINILMTKEIDHNGNEKDALDQSEAIYNKLTKIEPPFITSTRCGHMVMDEHKNETVISEVAFLIMSNDASNKNVYFIFNFDKDRKFRSITYEADEVLDLSDISIDDYSYDDVMTAAEPFTTFLSDQFRFYS